MILAALILCSEAGLAAWLGPIETEIWEITPSRTGTRWIVIHNLASADLDGVYHVEVLERQFGAEDWNIKHIANHMAVSPSALRASILKPLNRGAVYPESFNSAFAEWKKQSAESMAFVCTSTILECLR